MLRQIALVSQTASLSGSELASGAAALQCQVTRDLALHWSINATVDDFPTLDEVPVGYWPIIIENKIPQPGVAGYHTDERGQPFALVEFSPNWTLAVSHELIEMLVDPYGKTLVPGQSVDPSNRGRVQYLVEACDPCENPNNAYTVNGFLVSDFYTPRYFDPQKSAGVQYSANGKITEPRQILRIGQFFACSIRNSYMRLIKVGNLHSAAGLKDDSAHPSSLTGFGRREDCSRFIPTRRKSSIARI